MGRRGARVAEQDRWASSRLADDCAQRPGYPPELVERLASLAGGPGGRVADLGSGAGHLAVPLARRGACVLAVEAEPEMLRVLASQAGQSAVVPVAAAPEDTGLPARSCSLAVLADGLSSVEPGRAGREVARILEPGGVLAAVEQRFASTPFLDALSALVGAARSRQGSPPPGFVRRLFAAAGCRPLVSERFRHEEKLAGGRLDAVLRSLLYPQPHATPQALADLQERGRRLAAAHGGAVWKREITLTWARARG